MSTIRNRPQRTNNPGNLRFASQKEATGADEHGMAVFPTPEAGWRALHNQIRRYAIKGMNLKDMVNTYAPPNENNTTNYVSFVCRELKLEPTASVGSVSVFALAGIIAQIEGYYA